VGVKFSIVGVCYLGGEGGFQSKRRSGGSFFSEDFIVVVVHYCSTSTKLFAWGEGDSGGHVHDFLQTEACADQPQHRRLWRSRTPIARSLSRSPSSPPSSPPPSFTQSPFPPRSLVRDGQTSPQRRRFCCRESDFALQALVEGRAAKTEIVRVVLRWQSRGSEVRLSLPVGL
jgi:hypothetical protein